MRISAFYRLAPVLGLISIALFAGACQVNTANDNTAPANVVSVVNSNANTAVNANTATSASDAIEVREPTAYQAKISVSLQSVGSQAATALPSLTGQVAKSGADSTLTVVLPGGNSVTYLDKDSKHYVILPNRKQYAELNGTSTGVEWQRLMTPGQIVSHLKSTSGLQKLGDETWQGRAATKYRIAGTAKTNTAAAGDVSADALVYIDKDTGLPLHTETLTSATGDKAKGLQGKIVTEMTDISTTVDPASFELPAGYTKIPDEQVRQEVDKTENLVMNVVGRILTAMNNNSAPAAPSMPVASATPTPK